VARTRGVREEDIRQEEGLEHVYEDDVVTSWQLAMMRVGTEDKFMSNKV
jgi:hypothetical protein